MLDFRKPPQPPNPNPPFGIDRGQPIVSTSEATFFGKVYLCMFGGLLLTALVSMALARSETWFGLLYGSKIIYLVIFGVQIGIIYLINASLQRVNSLAVLGLFGLFAVSMSMTISLVLRVYPSYVVVKAFVSTAGVYGAMAVYGLVTKRSLQAWGAFLFMGVVGLIIASVVNLFLGSSALDFVICVIGVLIFAGLTAYDHQKLRVIHAGGFGDSEVENKTVIVGALNLYLDFINLFLFLVRLIGNRN
jgi:FtsH-binding integral membrane protein